MNNEQMDLRFPPPCIPPRRGGHRCTKPATLQQRFQGKSQAPNSKSHSCTELKLATLNQQQQYLSAEAPKYIGVKEDSEQQPATSNQRL